MRVLPGELTEIWIQDGAEVSIALKNIPYRDLYDELDRKNLYNLKMLDGALIQMMYRFCGDRIVAHRLAYLPSPTLEEFQNNPEIYLLDERYADITMKNIVPVPLRFDYDNAKSVAAEVTHPESHLTLGQYKNCRIPVSAALTPSHFLAFVLRSFYHTAYKEYLNELPKFTESFTASITSRERAIIHVQIPS